ncbi:MAG: ABC transporter permease [Pseudomonadota bacterium]
MPTKIFKSTFSGMGQAGLLVGEEVGKVVMMSGKIARLALSPPYRTREILRHLDIIGVQSVGLIIFTGFLAGMVNSLQAYQGLGKVGAITFVGATVTFGLAREVGPLITALLVICRSVSAMAAELAGMRNNYQIDALSVMAVDPVEYLVVPRVLAMVMVLPFLNLIFFFSGTIGSYLVCCCHLGIDSSAYQVGIRDYLEFADIAQGLFKSLVFGVAMSIVGCSEGYNAPVDPAGVGVATTKAIVISAVLVLGIDWVITALTYKPFT